MRMNPSKLQLVFRDNHGDLVRSGKLSVEEAQRRTDAVNARFTRQASEDFATIRDNRVAKPAWFRREEGLARRFVQQELGLIAAKGAQITILDSEASAATKALFPWDLSNEVYTHGFTSHSYGIVVRRAMLEMAQQQAVPRAIGKLLVHELVHAAEPYGPDFYQYYDAQRREWGTEFRQGFMTQKDDQVGRGMFFAEGLAEFAAGLYVRRRDDPNGPVVPMAAESGSSLPAYYERDNVDTGVAYTEGPDAYALECIARTLEARSVMNGDDFIRSLLGAYSLDRAARLSGLRTLAYGVNQVQLGLYAKLRDIPQTPGAWQYGLDVVLEALEISRD